MQIGIIGAGEIGGSLARRLTALGHTVSLANTRGPAALRELAAETGAIPVTASEAARSGEIVFVAIPICRIADLPADLFDGVGDDVVIVDTGNYYPRERDGRIDAIEGGMTESQWTSNVLGRPVLKAFNNLHWLSLLEGGRPGGASDRIALPVAGDDDRHKVRLFALLDQLGFDAVDAGPLATSWRQQPATPVYAANLDVEGVRRALSEADPARKAEFRANPDATIGNP
jgi:predicted dinucleotide-binding enzyme